MNGRFRDIKRQGRQRLHQAMGVPALYIPVQGATPVPCTVRVHSKFAALGQLSGNSGDAERAEAEPKIIFLASEVPTPRVNGVVSVEPGEAYRVAASDPVDDITITAKVTRLSVKDATGLPLPQDYPVAPMPIAGSPVTPGGGYGTVDYTDLDEGSDLFLPANQWVRVDRNLQPSSANFNPLRGPWAGFAFYRDGKLRARAVGDLYLFKFSYVVSPNTRGASLRFAVRPDGNADFDFGPSSVFTDVDAGQEMKNSTTFMQQARSRFVNAGAEIYVMLSTDGVLSQFSPEIAPLSYPVSA